MTTDNRIWSAPDTRARHASLRRRLRSAEGLPAPCGPARCTRLPPHVTDRPAAGACSSLRTARRTRQAGPPPPGGRCSPSLPPPAGGGAGPPPPPPPAGPATPPPPPPPRRRGRGGGAPG